MAYSNNEEQNDMLNNIRPLNNIPPPPLSEPPLLSRILGVENTCVICLTNLIDLEDQPGYIENVVLTKCNHVFHASCLDEWKKINPICPICRRPLYSVILKYLHKITRLLFYIVTKLFLLGFSISVILYDLIDEYKILAVINALIITLTVTINLIHIFTDRQYNSILQISFHTIKILIFSAQILMLIIISRYSVFLIEIKLTSGIMLLLDVVFYIIYSFKTYRRVFALEHILYSRWNDA